MYGGVSVVGNKTSQVEELLCGERLSEPEPMLRWGSISGHRRIQMLAVCKWKAGTGSRGKWGRVGGAAATGKE